MESLILSLHVVVCVVLVILVLLQSGKEGMGVIFGGGELLKDKNGVIVGAIGVSGGSVQEDTNVAKAGVAALNK